MAGAIVQTAKQSSALGTVTATFPSATTPGNTIVIGFAADDYNGTPDAGWQQKTGCEQQVFHGGYLWYRISTGETSVQYTIGSASNSAFVVAEISGLDTTDPYDTSNGQSTTSGGQASYTTPAITPSTGDRFLVAFMGGSVNSNLSAQSWGTWLNSFTAIDSQGSGGSGTNDLVGLAYRRVTGNGSTTYSSGATASLVLQSRSGIIISFKEAAASGTSLTGSSKTTASPTIGAPSFTAVRNVSASGLTRSANTIGAPALIAVANLPIASTFTRSANTIGAPGLAPVFNLTASNLPTSAATVGAPTLIAVNNVAASNLTTSTPSVAAATIGQIHALSASQVATTAPVVGSPAAISLMLLSASTLTTTAANIAAPTLTPRHELLAASLTLSLALGAPALTAVNGISASPLTLSLTTLGTASLAPVFNVAASNVGISAPTVSAATLNLIINAAVVNLPVSSPSFTRPALQAYDNLDAAGLETTSVVVNAATIAVTAHLTAGNVQTQATTIGTPEMVGVVLAEVGTVETSALVIGSATLGQRHALSVAGLATDSPVMPNLQVFLTGEIAAVNLVTAASSIGAPDLVERVSHLGSASFQSAAPSIPAVSFKQVHVLASEDVQLGAPIFDSATLVQTHVLTGASVSVQTEIGVPEFVQVSAFEAVEIEASAQLSPLSVGIQYNASVPEIVVDVSVGTVSMYIVGQTGAASLVLSSPGLGLPTLGTTGALTAASLVKEAPVFSPFLFDNGFRDLAAANLSVTPLVAAPPISQKHVLSNAVFAPTYPIVPSPLMLNRFGLEPLHYTQVVGVRKYSKGVIAGKFTRGKATVVGRPIHRRETA